MRIHFAAALLAPIRLLPALTKVAFSLLYGSTSICLRQAPVKKNCWQPRFAAALLQLQLRNAMLHQPSSRGNSTQWRSPNCFPSVSRIQILVLLSRQTCSPGSRASSMKLGSNAESALLPTTSLDITFSAQSAACHLFAGSDAEPLQARQAKQRSAASGIYGWSSGCNDAQRGQTGLARPALTASEAQNRNCPRFE